VRPPTAALPRRLANPLLPNAALAWRVDGSDASLPAHPLALLDAPLRCALVQDVAALRACGGGGGDGGGGDGDGDGGSDGGDAAELGGLEADIYAVLPLRAASPAAAPASGPAPAPALPLLCVAAAQSDRGSDMLTAFVSRGPDPWRYSGDVTQRRSTALSRR